MGHCRRSWTWSGAGWHGSSRSWQQRWQQHGDSGMKGCCVPRARSSRWVLGGPCCVPAAPAERIPVQALALKEEEKAALAGTLAGLQQSLAQATAELERQRHENASWQQQQQVGAQHRHPNCKPGAWASSLDALFPLHTLHPHCKSLTPLPPLEPPALHSSAHPSSSSTARRSCARCRHSWRQQQRPTHARPRLSVSRQWQHPSSVTAPCVM